MKTIWNILAVMAILNLIAIVGLLGWLKATDRFSRERAVAVKEMFTRTIAQEQAEVASAAEDAKRKDVELAQAKKMAEPPTTAAEKIAEQQSKDDQQLQVIQRNRQDLDNFQKGLFTQLAKLEDREKKLEAERKAFAAERKKIAETEGDKQFQVALATLDGQKAKDAKQVLRAMLDQRQSDQVVAYLAKMEEGKRSKVMAEFVKDDPSMAAELLERLRTRGIVVPPSGSLAQASGNESTGSAAANGVGSGGPGGGGGGASGPSGPGR